MGISWEEIKERKRPSRREVELSLDPGLALDVARAQAKADEARQALELRPGNVNRQQALDEALETLDAAQAALEPNLVTFIVEALGREDFEALVDAHPPTKEQRERWRKENPQKAALGQTSPWNDETFPVALLAACVVEPTLSEGQARELWDGKVFNQGETTMLLAACIEINQNARVVDMGKGSRQTDTSASSSSSALSSA